MPTYNRESVIEKSIQSILSQSFSNFELIIINDGSTDNTSKLISEISDERISIYNQNNIRQTQSRRIACEFSNGKYFAFCDSDDIWSSDYLEKVYDVFEKYNAEYIFTNYICSGEQNPRIRLDNKNTKLWLENSSQKISEKLYQFDDLYVALLKYQPIFTSCQVISKRHYLDIGGISKNINNLELNTKVTSEDSHIIRKSALTQSAFFINETLVTLGRQGDNQSSNYISNLEGGLFILNDLLETSCLSGKQNFKTKREIANHKRELCLQYYYYGKNKDFREYYSKNFSVTFHWKSHIHYVIAALRVFFA